MCIRDSFVHLPIKFHPNRPSATELWRRLHFLRWRSGHRNSTSGFDFRDFTYLRRSKSTCIPNFSKISQSTAVILLLPVSKNKCPLCWIFITSGSDFNVCVTIGMSFCICLPNFVQIGPSATELWRHIHFSRWRPRHRNSTSGFGFRNYTSLGRQKSTCRPNFGDISQSTAVILLLPVSKNKRPPCWNFTSGSDFYVCVTMGMS